MRLIGSARFAGLVAALALVATLAACGAGPEPTPTSPPAAVPGRGAAGAAGGAATNGQAKRYGAPPPLTIDVNKGYTALIKTTKGDIKVELNARDAPQTVNNFVFLAREGFYDNTPFHRVISGFMIQGGDPTGTGAGGPGYRFNDETPKTGYEIGSIAMANSGPNTNGSQFFICEGQQCTSLPRNYNHFGKVVEGMDVVSRIANVPKTLGADGAQSKPTEDVRINTIEIIER